MVKGILYLYAVEFGCMCVMHLHFSLTVTNQCLFQRLQKHSFTLTLPFAICFFYSFLFEEK